MEEKQEQDMFREWVLLELMRRKRLFGLLQETTLPGNMYRIDLFIGEDKEPALTQFYSPAAVYCFTPASEEVARQMSRENQFAPVKRWEFPPAGGEEEPF